MEIYKGQSISGGVVIGKISISQTQSCRVDKRKIDDTDLEWYRYEQARILAIENLDRLYVSTKDNLGKGKAEIFEVQKMMAEDPDYNNSIKEIIINQCLNAEYAVATTRDMFKNMIAEIKDEYLKERTIDICDISNRIIYILNESCDMENFGVSCVIVADCFTPSDVVKIDRSKVLAFVTRQGSVNSHTAILARAMGIPALTGVDIKDSCDGKVVIVDAENGILIVSPNKKELDRYREQIQVLKKQGEPRKLIIPNHITSKRRKINVYANINSISDIDTALMNGAEGIGLFRSEVLYLNRDTFPTEDEQFATYRQVIEAMAGKAVIIRTLDVGADKRPDYFNLEEEENPAMGLRAIRLCLKHKEVFKTQLRALLRASAYGKTAIMYPLISSVDELHNARKIVEVVKQELNQSGVKYGIVEQGIMVETPAAAIISDLLAKEVDFMSIGTNDLTQFTLAVDRQNSGLYGLYDSHHEAVIRLIRLVVKNAHNAGIRVGICGELGYDMNLIEEFVRIGVDELSVPLEHIYSLKKIATKVID